MSDRRRPPPLAAERSLAGVAIPDSAAARAAEELCRAASPWSLYAHAARSYLFAAAIADLRREPVDREALYVACLLHDTGLTDSYASPARPFEEVGGDVALALAGRFDWPAERAANAQRSIVLHMATEIADEESAEVRMLEAGVACDVSGRGAGELSAAVAREILRRLPRGPFKTEFAGLMRREAVTKPDSAAALLAQHGLLEAIAGAPFPDSPLPAGALG